MARSDLDNVRRAAVKFRKAEAELAVAIVTAIASGETLRDIGKYASYPHQRVQRIAMEYGRRRPVEDDQESD